MLTYIVRRLLLMIPTLLGMTAVVFFVMALSPGGVGGTDLTDAGEIDPVAREAMRNYFEQRYGLDAPLPLQYARWLNRVSPFGWGHDEAGRIAWGLPQFKAPDLGESFSKRRSVTSLFAEALPITLLLNVITIPIVWGVAILAGVYMARFRGQSFDVGAGVTLLGLWSVPVIWAGVLLLGFLASNQYLHWFPTGGLSSPTADLMTFLPSRSQVSDPVTGAKTWAWSRGWLLDRVWHLVLPILCLAYGSFAVLAKLMRASVLENITADYIRTARAKGVLDRDVLWRHALRNSLIPMITVAAGIIPGLLGGSLIVEYIFSIDGMGRLAIEAINARDRELVMAATLISGVLGLLSILVADLLYTVADPRVSYE